MDKPQLLKIFMEYGHYGQIMGIMKCPNHSWGPQLYHNLVNQGRHCVGRAVSLQQIHRFAAASQSSNRFPRAVLHLLSLACCRKELHQATRSHAVPAMPYDPGEQGAGPGEHPDVLVAPDEEGQGAASSEIFSRASEPSVISGRRLSHDAATISVVN